MILRGIRYCGVSLLLLAVATVSRAQVLAVSEHGFVSQHVLLLAASPDEAYKALTAHINLWWDASHSHGGDPSAFSLQAVAGGCFCEQLKGGGSVEHMRVVNAQPGVMLTLQGGLGPLQNMGVAGSMVFAFAPHAQGSELTYRYTVGGFTAGGLQGLAEPVDRVQLGQLQRLQAYLARGQALNPQ